MTVYDSQIPAAAAGYFAALPRGPQERPVRPDHPGARGGLTMWEVRRHVDCLAGCTPREISTSAEFPGYSIIHEDGADHYQVITPAGPIGTSPKFALAVQLVAMDMTLVARAVQVDLEAGQ
jgi:hypothetical protein